MKHNRIELVRVFCAVRPRAALLKKWQLPPVFCDICTLAMLLRCYTDFNLLHTEILQIIELQCFARTKSFSCVFLCRNTPRRPVGKSAIAIGVLRNMR